MAMYAFNLTFPSPIPDPEEPIANMARNGNSEILTSSTVDGFDDRSGCDAWDSPTCEEHVDEAQPEGSSEKWKDFNDSVWSSTEKGDWDESSAILPGDPDYMDPSKNSENEEDRVKSATEIKYEELPFIRKHYFLNHALHIPEAICLRTGRQRFRKYLEDLVWK
ncbi:hypothetical protein BDR22DRAFT_884721 [Usnea florida]